MDFFKILKGGVGLGMSNFDRLFAEKYGGGAWQLTTLTGTLPLTFQSKGTPLTDYKLYGTSEGAGVETENLFDKDAKDPDNGYVYHSQLISNGSVTAYSNTDVSEYIAITPGEKYVFNYGGTYNSVFACIYDEQKNFIRSIKYSNNRILRFTANTGEWFFRMSYANKWVEQAAVYRGETFITPIQPYGYKLQMTVTSEEESTDIPIYIGDSKLMAEEYVDYEEQKVYKLKEVHKDTVTINGIEWDILGYNHDTVYKSDNTLAQHTVTIQTHDCVNSLQFDAREALFAFPDGLAAGSYSFTIKAHTWVSSDIDKSITFTLTQAIPKGGQLVVSQAFNASFTTGNILSYASSSATEPIETVKMNEGDTGTSLGDVTNAIVDNTNSCQKALLGSNRWSTSAIRQYLNSDKAARTFWEPQTIFDRPPSWVATTAGFLYGMDIDFISVLGKTKKRTALNTVSDGGGYEDSVEKVFLLSRSEVYAGNENNIDEGGPYDYFKDFSDFSAPSIGKDTNRIKYKNGAANYWWLRPPYTGGSYSARLIYPAGELRSSYAMNSYCVAPACCIVLDDINTNPYLQSLFLKPTDPPVALPELSTYQGENTLSCSEGLGEVNITGYIKGE